MMRHDGRVQSRKCVRGLLCAEAMARWRRPCTLILFLLLTVGEWNGDISGNVTTDVSAWSHSPTGMWGWVSHRYEWLDGKRNISPKRKKKKRICTNCCWIVVKPLLGFICRDATHSGWLTLQMSVAGRNAIMNLGTESLNSLGVFPPHAAESFPANFCPSLFLL